MSNAASAASPSFTPSLAFTPSLDEVAVRLSITKRYVGAAILLWFALAVSPNWLPTPDSALYLMLGRSMAQGHGYALDGRPHAYVPPGYPAFLAVLERIGLGNMLWLNLAMGIIGVLSVWMSYRLISELASRPVALLIAGLLGLNSLLHVMSSMQLSDMPFTLLTLTALYCFLRGLRGDRWALELGTLAILASCWVRVAGVALAVACAVGLLLQPRNTSGLRVAGNAAALLVGVAATLSLFYGQYQHSLQAEHSLPPASYMAGVQALVSQPVGSVVVRALKNTYESAAELPRFLLGMKGHPLPALAICLIPALVGIGRRLVRRDFLITLAVAGYSAGIVLNLPAGARYLLPIAPLLVLYYLEGLSVLLDWHPRVRRWAPQVLFVLMIGFVALNGIKGLHASYKNYHQIAAERTFLTESAECLRSHAQPGDHFLSCYGEWQLAYLSGVPYLQLDRWSLMGVVPRDQYLRFLFDQRVRFVVACSDIIANMPDDALIRDAVQNPRLFQPIAVYGHFQVYRFLGPPANATAALPPPPGRQLLQ